MIIITGATGQLGRAIVQSLVKRVGASALGVSVRDPAKAADLQSLGVRVRGGDFDDADGLRHAFEGATKVVIVSSNARAYGGDTLAQHRTAVTAAREAGARRILYTSHMAASSSSAFPPMLDHAATEELLRQSGVSWTALRNGFYASSAVPMMGDALQSGVLAAPRDGKVSWTAHADLAEAAAIIAASDGGYDGPTPPLTAVQSLDLEEVAALASDILGRPIRRELVTEEAQRARLAARNLPDVVIAVALGFYRASEAGEFATIDATLQNLLGRPPTALRDVLQSKLGG